ncbi:MAG TPA: gluconate 2-dehydrogenase subunit 3 family protein [Chitinophagaceae bacterium]
MDRRELLKMIAAATGGVVIGGEFFLAGCKNPDAGVGTSATFTESDIAFLDEVAETIFPKTSTPGAKEAKVGQYMTVMVTDCYEEKDQKTFHEGMKKLDEACNKMHGHSFMKAAPEHRKELLTSIDKEAKEYQDKRKKFSDQQTEKAKEENAKGNKDFKKETMPPHYFTLMKQLTIAGYFTSKEGREGATNYQPVPGKYQGDVPYKKGDRVQTGLS